jgi:DNA-binding MarR family transcriptional regulator
MWIMESDESRASEPGTGEPWWAFTSFPSLIRTARRTYTTAIRAALAEAGCDDVPRNGAYVLASIEHAGAQLSRIIRDLAVSKQAAGQLIDTLVSRGYLDRSVDLQDRRRLNITLTDRGHAAADVITTAVREVDAQLRDRIGADRLRDARAVLAELADLGIADHEHGQAHDD